MFKLANRLVSLGKALDQLTVQSRGFKKLIVTKRTANFREAVTVEERDLKQPQGQEVLVKNHFVGINASDINYSAGRYDPTLIPPHGCGFESIGIVEDRGEGSKLDKGQAVAFFGTPARAFSEYIYATDKELIPLPAPKPELLNLMTTGLTSAIGLDESAHIKKGDKVLITAAAGGVGHVAVQWAKAKGCHVIGTCSSDSKVAKLKELGCDNVINYHAEDLKDAIKRQYPQGLDVIWDTVGGQQTELFVNSLAVKGRLVVIGAITGYSTEGTGFPAVNIPDLPLKLLTKSRVMAGFFLPDYSKLYKEYLLKLLQLYSDGNLKLLFDDGSTTSDGGKFKGIDGIIRAVEHLHQKKNVGKVVAEI